MMRLTEKHCIPCRGGVPPMTVEQAQEYLREIAGWELMDGKKIVKEFKFKKYLESLEFAQRVGELAEREGHHPYIHIFYKKVRIEIWTHKIDGLTESDFILAAKIDDLGSGPHPQPLSRSDLRERGAVRRGEGLTEWPGVYARYREHLPSIADENIITLLEGGTPLVRAQNLERRFGLSCALYLKCEGANPTGSFKDRGMTVAIS
ncbi:MAG: 4a-hydroxytetrahydrobiopterin dehydratase, partial [Candidatus Bipolaricaulota bacterium]|nr:4a-hydroxytetrahydrobiopterin dehydratase [Candidatus Bipolaricaulota bacterium]